MALTFPIPLSGFFSNLPIASGTADLGEAVEMSETGYGEILTAENGNRLWSLDIEIASRNYEEGSRISALLDVLRYPGRSLIARATPVVGPFSDPGGIVATGFNPTLYSVDTNNRNLVLAGIYSVGYEMRAGDFLSFQYGSDPIRYALHRVCVGGVADSSNHLALEVTPFIQPGYTLGTAVNIIRPVFKAIVKPGSTKAGKIAQSRVEGIQFSLLQTFR